MAIPVKNRTQFLGRVFDVQTYMWVFPEGSGQPLPEEARVCILDAITSPRPNGGLVLSTIFKLPVDKRE